MLDTDHSPEFLSEAFYCDPDNGILVWRHRPDHHFKSKGAARNWRKRFALSVAGCDCPTTKSGMQYRHVTVGGRRVCAHRIIWTLCNNAPPKNYIDHINGNGLDNRIENLRDVPLAENVKNMRKYKNNKSGVCGVIWRKDKLKWRAFIQDSKNWTSIGMFDDFFEAVCARKSAENKLGFTARHGT